jgi:hypothetical protein
VFRAEDAVGPGVWSTDGTLGRTAFLQRSSPLGEPPSGVTFRRTSDLIQLGARAFFVASTGAGWATRLLLYASTGIGSGGPRLLFTAGVPGSQNRRQLFRLELATDIIRPVDESSASVDP